MKSYATKYKNIVFRSRLEAKWAAFFDLLGWEWDYEPFDLEGYIPDFILKFYKPLLVEVKPAMYFGDLGAYTEKVDRSRWDKEILIVGATLFSSSFVDFPCIGLLKEVTKEVIVDWDSDEEGYVDCGQGYGEGIIFECERCRRYSIFHNIGSFHCRVTGCYEGDHHLSLHDPSIVDKFWARAGNIVQWKGIDEPARRTQAVHRRASRGVV